MSVNILKSVLLEKYSGITHGFLNAPVDVNVKRIAREQSLDHIYSLKQVHSDRLVFFGKEYDKDAGIMEGDSLITGLRKKGVCVFTADCVPIIVFERSSKLISAIHAGWRGTLNKIALKTINRMKDESHAKSYDFSAVIGPSIGVCCYEVDSDFAERFTLEFGSNENCIVKSGNGKYMIDLGEINRQQLLESGVSEIDKIDICTKCNSDYPSYRREGKKAGRMISFIGLL